MFVTALTASLFLTGCFGPEENEPPQQSEELPSSLESAAPPATDEARIELPETDFTDARSVATSFWIAWKSYDGMADTDETYVDRYRPFVTEYFLDKHEDEGIPVPPQNLTAFRESGRLRTAEVEDIEVPETAGESDQQVVLTIEGQLIDVDHDGEELGPREASLTVLVNNIGEGEPDWRVDRLLYQ